jgi:hypothetical protein
MKNLNNNKYNYILVINITNKCSTIGNVYYIITLHNMLLSLRITSYD